MRWLPDSVIARLQAEVRMPDLSGTRYHAIRFLGRGGMGAVWLAEDEVLARNVAVKILSLESSSPELSQRMTREAQVLARLEHPGIVPVHDAGTLADGRTFYCMKYVEGQNLGEFIVGRGLRECLQLLQRIAEPLAFAHSRGIIHRDLKPGNVMVGRFGEVLVMDWGLAKLTSDQSNGRKTVQSKSTAASKNNEASTLALPPASLPAPTAHGTVLGTPGFMAPEQERGDIEAIDERTDVFGLGAVLNFMLESAKKQGPDAGKSISKPLAAIRDQAMAADQAQRYSSVLALSADIGLYLDGLPVSAYPENVWERGARLFARHQVAVVLVLAYLLMRLSFALFSSR